MKYTCRDQLRDIFGEGLVRRYDCGLKSVAVKFR